MENRKRREEILPSARHRLPEKRTNTHTYIAYNERHKIRNFSFFQIFFYWYAREKHVHWEGQWPSLVYFFLFFCASLLPIYISFCLVCHNWICFSLSLSFVWWAWTHKIFSCISPPLRIIHIMNSNYVTTCECLTLCLDTIKHNF